jgi:hypothetical protein
MTKFTSLLAVPLMLASVSAWSAADPANLTYCLDLKSNAEIAKCAGEVSAGNKGKPFTKEEVEKLVAQEKAAAPAANAKEPSGKPAAPDAKAPSEEPAAAATDEPSAKPATSDSMDGTPKEEK